MVMCSTAEKEQNFEHYAASNESQQNIRIMWDNMTEPDLYTKSSHLPEVTTKRV